MVPANLESPGWLEVEIDLPEPSHDSMSGFLFDLGSEGLITEGCRLKSYFRLPQDPESLKNRILLFLRELRGFFPEIGSSSLSLSRVESRNWSESWRRFFHPEKVTPKLWIVPLWESPPSGVQGEVILMDPGPAFGTGQHATTRMCLLAMERIPLPHGWSMLDVGTGSGILAIYGAKLGAGPITAVDIDPEALRWARRNIEINHVSGRIELTDCPVHSLKEHFSLIVANLTTVVITGLLESFNRLLGPGGTLILSGLLRHDLERVRHALRERGFLLGKSLKRDEWACVITRRKERGPSRPWKRSDTISLG